MKSEKKNLLYDTHYTVDLCLCVRTSLSNHVPYLSSKKVVQLCSFAADITLHNRQGSLKQGGDSLALRTARQTGGDFFLIRSLFPSAGFSFATMAQPTTTDPTKMGVGRAIAVLTSGGDAQGEYAGIAGRGVMWVIENCLDIVESWRSGTVGHTRLWAKPIVNAIRCLNSNHCSCLLSI